MLKCAVKKGIRINREIVVKYDGKGKWEGIEVKEGEKNE